ncbi:MAG: DUF4440 domain-containing protein [Caldilinea sp. CFX5]|nr:DUF4440 domain-containing protein [Caldilinea sp. CFX5]
MNEDLQDFEQFMKQREAASAAYVQGNAEPLGELVARGLPATFFGPGGGYVQGAHDVWSRYEQDAELFAQGSRFRFEVLQMAAGPGLAYWVGFMEGNAYLSGQAEAIPMKLRVTELFRREDGEWKLVHRHADALAESQG